MADNISKTISIDVDINTDGQQQIAQYKTAFDSLRSSISGLSNPLSGLSGSINSLDQDVAKLTGSIDKLSKQNLNLAASGDKTKGKVLELASSFSDWKSAIAGISESLGGWGIVIAGVLALLSTFKETIYDWVKEMINGTTTLTALGKALKDAKMVMDGVNRSRMEGLQSAQKELVNLKLLYDATQNQKLSIEQRKTAMDALKNLYPSALKNISDDAILTGKAGDAYQNLTKQIIASYQARSAESTITANQQRILENDEKIAKITADRLINQEKLNKALATQPKTIEHPPMAVGGGAADWGNSAETDSYNLITKLQKQKDAYDKLIGNIQTDKALLLGQNKSLSDAVSADIKKYGAQILTGDQKLSEAHSQAIGEISHQQSKTISEGDKMLQESLSRQLQATYSAYGSETVAENQRYEEEKAKLQKLLNDKLVSKKQYDAVSQQLENENHANISTIIDKYNEQDKQRTEQAQNELNELKIKGMKDGTAKQIAELQQQQTEQVEQLDKTEQESVDHMKKLYAEITQAKDTNPKADTGELQSQLNTEINLQEINSQKRIQIEQQTAAAIKKIKDEEAQDTLMKVDQKGVDDAKTPDAKLTADKKLITDKYQFEIEQAQGNAAAILALQTELNAQLKKLDDDSAKQKTEAEKAKQEKIKAEILKDATQIEGEVLSLIAGTIKQQADAKVAALEKDKTAELSNTRLTSAQKLAIQQKYKQQEGQIKAKAFKEEQEASIAQAIINGALAVTKVSAQTGVLAAIGIGAVVAETAIQVAKIASQKPPAYAKGGLHYSSDGRGGLLPGYSRTDNTNAFLRSGEGIVVSEAMRVPWARNLVSAINVGFGGRDFSIANPGRGYAVGGIFTDGGDANRYYNAPVTDQKNLANSIAYQMINNFPPVYVDVKDVNNQQNILAQTINRVNL